MDFSLLSNFLTLAIVLTIALTIAGLALNTRD
jgi:hypothetical protein